MDLQELRTRLQRFADERDWNQFHSPKNLVMALTVEVAEVAEHFQWLTEEASRDLPQATRDAVVAEIADVQIYLVRLADILEINLLETAEAKLLENEAKYPPGRVRGSARKYTEYDEPESEPQ